MLLLVAACASVNHATESRVQPGLSHGAEAGSSSRRPAEASRRLAAFFESFDAAELRLSPMSKAYRGIKDSDYGRWDHPGEAAAIASHNLEISALNTLHANFQRGGLSPADQLSFDLFDFEMRRRDSIFPFRRNRFVFDQRGGVHTDYPAFLINIHSVATESDARYYIDRLEGLGAVVEEAVAEAGVRERLGVLPPKWVFPYVIRDAQRIITGAPFDQGPDSPLLADLRGKLERLAIPTSTKSALLADGERALLRLRPAYTSLIALMRAEEGRAGTDDGIWRLPQGAANYRALIRYYTTTDLDADQIHEIGLREVARIHREIEGLMRRIGYTGTLRSFFEMMRSDRRFYLPDTAEGRAQYLGEVRTAQASIEQALPRFFQTLPRAALVVREVESFRRSSGRAFYEDPTPDGSRPGTFYVNLSNMNDMPTTEIEALFCHEGIPGHHLQNAVQAELAGDVPPFRKFGNYTAYGEGWGLYAEGLCLEMGQYRDPYRDFGRLQLELNRAIRLVVDTGIHARRWSREQAIRYVEENSAFASGGIVQQVQRYIANPGQAVAYTIGKVRIEELRRRAEHDLGPAFNLREFHDVVLGSGAVPLDILERNVIQWIELKAGSRRVGSN